MSSRFASRNSTWCASIFLNLQHCHYRLLARLDRVTGNLGTLRWLARIDRALLAVPGFRSLAGTAVMWATR